MSSRYVWLLVEVVDLDLCMGEEVEISLFVIFLSATAGLTWIR